MVLGHKTRRTGSAIKSHQTAELIHHYVLGPCLLTQLTSGLKASGTIVHPKGRNFLCWTTLLRPIFRPRSGRSSVMQEETEEGWKRHDNRPHSVIGQSIVHVQKELTCPKHLGAGKTQKTRTLLRTGSRRTQQPSSGSVIRDPKRYTLKRRDCWNTVCLPSASACEGHRQ